MVLQWDCQQQQYCSIAQWWLCRRWRAVAFRNRTKCEIIPHNSTRNAEHQVFALFILSIVGTTNRSRLPASFYLCSVSICLLITVLMSIKSIRLPTHCRRQPTNHSTTNIQPIRMMLMMLMMMRPYRQPMDWWTMATRREVHSCSNYFNRNCVQSHVISTAHLHLRLPIISSITHICSHIISSFRVRCALTANLFFVVAMLGQVGRTIAAASREGNS